MDNKLLNDKDIFPDIKVIKTELGGFYVVYEKFLKAITGNEYSLNPEWRYYNDGKWLCKVTYKKKTIIWVSLWEKYIKATFYFSEKNGLGINDLKISKKLKTSFWDNKSIGKFKPLIINIKTENHINDVLKVVKYKKSLK
ncbi:MAG: DUF3788 domain-containing protein [Spirochaetaceae bacterium]|nr:DUF3788 domain-containing protein [Spirochaetaceae bacterium]